jgi:hypothetical protein
MTCGTHPAKSRRAALACAVQGDHAGAVEPRALASSNRRAALGIEKARALHMLGKDGPAIGELRHAERLSPAQLHNYPLVREMVTGMLEHARREAGSRELRGLAWRMGVI